MASTASNPVAIIRQNLSVMAPELEAALPKHVTVEKFSRVAMTAIQNNPSLQNADRRSLFGAIVRLAQDGLLPDGREAALVMFGNKAQAMPMIAGVLKKIRQSGEVAKVSSQVVYKNDHFIMKYGFDEDVEHSPPPLDEPRGDPIGAYATAVLKDGSRMLEVMSLEEIEKVRAVSRAARNGPWVSWWEEMARKTVMRRLSKRLPMSTDLEDDMFRRDETMSAVIDGVAVQREAKREPTSRLDALEHFIGEDDEPGEPEIEQAQADAFEEELDEPEPAAPAPKRKGKSVAERMEEMSPTQESPAVAFLDKVRGMIATSQSDLGLKAADDEWVKHRAAYGDDEVAEIDGLLAAKRREIAA